MKKIKKKNPRKGYFDEYYVLLLCRAFSSNYYDAKEYLSNILSYTVLGHNKCDDCGNSFKFCHCEGARNITSTTWCEECLQNYCICDYNIKTTDDIRDLIFELAIYNLDIEKLYNFYRCINEFKDHITESMKFNDNLINMKIKTNLNKINSILHNLKIILNTKLSRKPIKMNLFGRDVIVDKV